MKKTITEKITVTEGVQITQSKNTILIKGPKGEIKREFHHPNLHITTNTNEVSITSKNATKREKRMIYTFTAHIKNMITGVLTPFTYKLKVCSSHFPMTVTLAGKKLSVKNFLGEKTPREITLPNDVNVKVDGQMITVESPDLELAGNTASAIELITRAKGKDIRVFQDGIYITEKTGIPVSEL